MGDKSQKPDLMARFHDQGADLAHRAENGHLSEVIKEIDTLKKHLGKGEYNALMRNIQGVNTADVIEDQRNVAEENKKHWFGIGDKKPMLPTLLFEDPDKDGIPNRLIGWTLPDGTQKVEPKETKQPEPKTAPKANNGETILMLNPNSEEAADHVWTQMQKK